MTDIRPEDIERPELPSGWAWSELLELAAVEPNALTDGPFGSNLKSEHYVASGVRVIRLGNLGVGHFKDEDRSFITHEQYAGLRKHTALPGDLVVAALAEPVGRACEVPEDIGTAIVKADCVRFKPHPELQRQFVMGWLNSPSGLKNAAKLSHGIGRLRMNLANMRALPVPVAPLSEQRRIVAKLDALQARSEAAKEALDAIPPLLEKFRQSVLASAFRGDLTRKWREQNPDVEPASELLARIRAERRRRWQEANPKKQYVEPEPVDATGLPELPERWCWAPLEDLVPAEAPIVYGIVQPGEHVVDGVPFVRPADITAGDVSLDSLPRTSHEIAWKYRRAELDAGDLVFSIVGTIGKSLVVPESLRGANITQSSVRIRALPPLDAEYVLRALQSPTLRTQMSQLAFGVAVQRLNVEHVRRLAVPLMPTNEWHALLSQLRQALATTHTSHQLALRLRSKLDGLNQSILAKAFRGELVPQDSNDEPAAVLLERIKAERAASGAVVKPRRGRKAQD